MRYTISILLTALASIANAADFALPVDASWSGATVTLVASRDGTQLGTGSGTIAQLASGQYKASATIDLSGAGAGEVTVTVVDASGNMAAVGSGYYVNAAGALVSQLISAYDPATYAETQALTNSLASDLTLVLADTAELQGDWANGGRLDLLLDTTISQTLASAIRSAVGLASANLDTQFSTIGGGSAVSPDTVSAKRTWIADDYRARNIVEVEANFAGVLALKPDLNPGTTIATVDSVSITGAATVTATSLTVDRSKTKAHFTVPALTTEGTYTVLVTVTTIEGDVIPTTATLIVN